MRTLPLLRALSALLGAVAVLGAAFAAGRWSAERAAIAAGGALLSGATGRLYRAKKSHEYRGVRHFHVAALPKLRPYPTINETCGRWCVFTTINPPTLPVQQCASLRGWCVVVVGDKKSPPVYTVPSNAFSRVVYLNQAAQQALPYRILPLLPWNHFARKNLGFIYAIHHGAKVILDIDDDNELLPIAKLSSGLAPRLALLGHRLGAHNTGVPLWHVPVGTALFNPYPWFRMRAADATAEEAERYPAWPRGFPLDGVLDPTTRPPLLRNWSAAAAATATTWPSSRQPQLGCIQLLADHDPDVDAIFRLSRQLPQTFGERQAVVALPAGTMAPFNAQALLVARSAFWGLLLPASVNGRVSDIWRSYAWQRLMWHADLALAFSSPLIRQVRNVHSYLADFNAELPLYERSGELVSLLKRLPLRSAHLPGLVEEVVVALHMGRVSEYVVKLRPSARRLCRELSARHAMPVPCPCTCRYEYGILELFDVKLTQAFLLDLIATGYEFPAVTLNPAGRPHAARASVDEYELQHAAPGAEVKLQQLLHPATRSRSPHSM